MPGYQPLGKFPPFHQSGGKISFSQIRGGIINAEEIILAGGTKGRIRSENYDPTNETGWGIFGDGSASFYGDVFFGENAVFQGDLYSSNWDGTLPLDLSSVDTGATAGFALDSSAGTMQIMGDMFVGGNVTLISGGVFQTASGTDRLEITGSEAQNILFYDNNLTVGMVGWNNADSVFRVRAEFHDLVLQTDGSGNVWLRPWTQAFPPDGGQVVLAVGGTAAKPGLSFYDGDTTYHDGFFYDAVNNYIGVTIAGTSRVRFGGSPYMEFDFAGAGGEAIRFWETSGGGRSYAIRRTANFGGFQFVGITSGGSESVVYEIYDNHQFRVSDGSATSPAITFIGDNNTGIYRAGSDIVAFATGGTLRGSFQADGFYATTPNATGSAANLVTAGAAHNNFMRSTSARKYKTEITYDPEQLLAVELRPAKFYRPDDDAWYYGFIADDLAEEDPLLGTYDPETGEIENYDQRAVMAVMAAKLNEMARKIRELEAEVARLRGEKEIY